MSFATGDLASPPRKRRYLVTRTETTEVEARSEAAAEQLGDLKIEFNGPDTVDIQAEALRDSG